MKTLFIAFKEKLRALSLWIRLTGLQEPYRQEQLIMMQGDIEKDMCMIKPYKLLCNFLRRQFFLRTLTNHPWIMKDGAVVIVPLHLLK